MSYTCMYIYIYIYIHMGPAEASEYSPVQPAQLTLQVGAQRMSLLMLPFPESSG